jgi:hypothetical protein
MMADAAPVSRSELVTLVARSLQGASYAETKVAGQELASQSKLPRLIAENLGAGFGQWDFFPEAAEIVDFALAYTPPSTEEEVWALARKWAADDAAGRHTLLALVGRDVLQQELRRIAVPKLRELFDEVDPAREIALRKELGLEAPAGAPAPKRKAVGPRTPRAPVVKREIPTRMPKPEFKAPVKAPPPPPPKRFVHPKFGEGVLESQSGVGPEAKLTIKFASGSKTLQAQYLTELPAE